MDGPPGTEEESSFRSFRNSSDSAGNSANTSSGIHRPSRRESLRSSRATATAAISEVSLTPAPASFRSPEHKSTDQTDTAKRPASGSLATSIITAIPALFSWQESGERRSPRLASLSSSGSQPSDAVVSSSRKTAKRPVHISPRKADESPLRRATATVDGWTTPELAAAPGADASGGSFDPREDRREKRVRTASEQTARETSPRGVAHGIAVQDSSVRRSARIRDHARPAAVEPETGDEPDDNDYVRSASGPGGATASAADGANQSVLFASELSSQQTDRLVSAAGKLATTIADPPARSPVLGKRQRQSLLDRWLRPRSQQEQQTSGSNTHEPDATGTDSLEEARTSLGSTSQRPVADTARELAEVLAADDLADEGGGTPAPAQDTAEPQHVADDPTEALPPSATRQRAVWPNSRTQAELERSTNLAAIAASDGHGDPDLRSPTDAQAAEIAMVLQSMAAAGSPP
ncbi:hypothetical protein HK405_012608, partial [Cladochytrium tenue]